MHVGGGQTLLLSFASLAEVFVQRRSRETLVIFFTQAGKVATCVVGGGEGGYVVGGRGDFSSSAVAVTGKCSAVL